MVNVQALETGQSCLDPRHLGVARVPRIDNRIGGGYAHWLRAMRAKRLNLVTSFAGAIGSLHFR